MNLSIGLSLTRPSGPLGFNPASLFASGEEGAWYDPSDLTTLYQDSLGTTSAGVGDPVGLMLDKSKGGLSATELVTNGTFDTGTTGWTAEGSNTIAAVGGELEITLNSAQFNGANIAYATSLVVGKTYRITATARKGTSVSNFVVRLEGANQLSFTTTSSTTKSAIFTSTSTTASLRVLTGSSSGTGTIYVDNISVRELPGNHATQSTATARPTLQVTGTTPATLGSERVTNGTFDANIIGWSNYGSGGVGNPTWDNGRLKIDATSENDGARSTVNSLTIGKTYRLSADVELGTAAAVKLQIVGDVLLTASTNGVISGLFVASQSNPYLYAVTESGSTGTAWFDNVSVKEVLTWADPKYYLDFDGVDDGMTTAAVDFSVTSEASLFAAVDKQTEPANQTIVELSSTTNNSGMFALIGRSGSIKYGAASRGTNLALASTTDAAFTAPSKNVVSGLVSITGDLAELRLDGTSVDVDNTDQVDRAYLNAALNIMARNNASANWLDGHLYGLIIRGASSTAAEISGVESYLAAKSGVTL